MTAPASSGALTWLSIRWRLIALAIVLLGALAITTFYIRSELTRAEESSAHATERAAVSDTVGDVRGAFNDLRYWRADEAVSLLSLAEDNAAEARARLHDNLEDLSRAFPEEGAIIAEEVARFDDLSGQAVEAYTDDQRVVGNSFFAEARQAGDRVEEVISQLQERVGEEAAAARSGVMEQFSSASNVSQAVTLAAIVIGALLTLVILRSILRPLDSLVEAVKGLTDGRTDIELPPATNDELGRVSQALALLRDSIGERDRYAREVQAERQTLVDAIESIAEGFSLYDADGHLRLTNQRFRDIHERHDELAARNATFEEVIRMAGHHVIQTNGDPEAWIERRLQTHGHHSSRVAEFLDGTWRQISERETHDGGFTVVYTDITEMRRRQEELEKARDEAERATQVKSEFLANMSHELRTPLNAIIGYSQILHEDAEESGQEDFLPDLKKIESAGDHLLRLINDILDLSKIEAGRMEVYKENFDVRGLIDDVEMLVRPLVERNRNELSITCGEDIGSIGSDVTKVKQALINLLSNAAKFTEAGTVELIVEARGKGSERVLSFLVRDSGIGMSEEQMSRLFQAFSQADSSTTRKFGGTGLGLAISRSFALMLGGDLTVESKPNEGTSFELTLPLKGEITEEELEALPARPETESERATVLVVDDDPASLHIIGSQLTRSGFTVVYAENGAKALALARAHKPDAITLDIMMPQMDGWSVLVALKKEPELADIPVVIVSVSNERALGFTLGASGMLAKPVDRNELTAFLARLIGSDIENKGTVLVVEDDPATQQLMQRTVERLGHDAVVTSNGREGMEWMASNPSPLVILLDLQMPEMNGFEFLHRLRADERWRELPVLVVTAQQLTNAEREMLSERTAEIIEKGKDAYLELSHAISRVIGETAVDVAAPAREN